MERRLQLWLLADKPDKPDLFYNQGNQRYPCHQRSIKCRG